MTTTPLLPAPSTAPTPLDQLPLERQNRILHLRCSAAELALYQLEERVRAVHADIAAVVRKVHEVNEQFPLGDGPDTGPIDLVVKAIRASVPGAAAMTDAQIQATYLQGVAVKSAHAG